MKKSENAPLWKPVIVVLVVLVLSFCITMSLKSQSRETPLPAVYLVTQPTDLGFGVRGDYHLNHWAGAYGSVSYGQWRYYKWSGLDDHIKATLGVLIPLKDFRGNQHDLSVGLNYHWVSGEVVPSDMFRDADIFHAPFSFELGLTIKYPRFALAFRTDVLRWEPCIDIGFTIGRRGMAAKRNRACNIYEK